jgi:hypothetical protein
VDRKELSEHMREIGSLEVADQVDRILELIERVKGHDTEVLLSLQSRLLHVYQMLGKNDEAIEFIRDIQPTKGLTSTHTASVADHLNCLLGPREALDFIARAAAVERLDEDDYFRVGVQLRVLVFELRLRAETDPKDPRVYELIDEISFADCSIPIRNLDLLYAARCLNEAGILDFRLTRPLKSTRHWELIEMSGTYGKELDELIQIADATCPWEHGWIKPRQAD